VRALGEALSSRGVSVLLSREPTNGPYGNRIRELAQLGRDEISPEEETQLFIRDREQHVRNVILPALAEGKVVILDRYFYSTAAYQGARGVDVNWILSTNRAFAPEPDLLVILKLDVPTALERIQMSRGDLPDHFEKAEYLHSVALIFDHIEHSHRLCLDARKQTSELVNWIIDELGAPDVLPTDKPKA